MYELKSKLARDFLANDTVAQKSREVVEVITMIILKEIEDGGRLKEPFHYMNLIDDTLTEREYVTLKASGDYDHVMEVLVRTISDPELRAKMFFGYHRGQ